MSLLCSVLSPWSKPLEDFTYSRSFTKQPGMDFLFCEFHTLLIHKTHCPPSKTTAGRGRRDILGTLSRKVIVSWRQCYEHSSLPFWIDFCTLAPREKQACLKKKEDTTKQKTPASLNKRLNLLALPLTWVIGYLGSAGWPRATDKTYLSSEWHHQGLVLPAALATLTHHQQKQQNTWHHHLQSGCGFE